MLDFFVKYTTYTRKMGMNSSLERLLHSSDPGAQVTLKQKRAKNVVIRDCGVRGGGPSYAGAPLRSKCDVFNM